MGLPLFIYFDEFEHDNALGSRTDFQKLGRLYAKISCIPEYLQSKLSHFFVAMLLFADDSKRFVNTTVFEAFRNELNNLLEFEIQIGERFSFEDRHIKRIR